MRVDYPTPGYGDDDEEDEDEKCCEAVHGEVLDGGCCLERWRMVMM